MSIQCTTCRWSIRNNMKANNGAAYGCKPRRAEYGLEGTCVDYSQYEPLISVGDKVWVRANIIDLNVIHGIGITPGMCALAGKRLTIIQERKPEQFRNHAWKVYENGWTWHDAWLTSTDPNKATTTQRRPTMSIDPKSTYYDAGGIETIKIIKAKLTKEQFKGYLLGCQLKYGCRLNHKGSALRDAEKINNYSSLLTEMLSAEDEQKAKTKEAPKVFDMDYAKCEQEYLATLAGPTPKTSTPTSDCCPEDSICSCSECDRDYIATLDGPAPSRSHHHG